MKVLYTISIAVIVVLTTVTVVSALYLALRIIWLEIYDTEKELKELKEGSKDDEHTN